MKHGATKHGGIATPEWRAWKRMRQSCYNPNRSDYPYYGGRGIRVCDAWLKDFPAFLACVGPRPSEEHSLDRIDNDGHYEPGNVRWATRSQQAQNKRRVVPTHCPVGHDYTEHGYRRPDTGYLECRTCGNERRRKK